MGGEGREKKMRCRMFLLLLWPGRLSLVPGTSPGVSPSPKEQPGAKGSGRFSTNSVFSPGTGKSALLMVGCPKYWRRYTLGEELTNE